MVRTVLIICILLFVVIPINVFASEDISVPDEYEELLNSIPDDVADMLPEELFADDIDNIAQGANKITSWNYIFDIMFNTGIRFVVGLHILIKFKEYGRKCI